MSLFPSRNPTTPAATKTYQLNPLKNHFSPPPVPSHWERKNGQANFSNSDFVPERRRRDARAPADTIRKAMVEGSGTEAKALARSCSKGPATPATGAEGRLVL